MKPWLKILIVAGVVALIGLGVYLVFQPQPLVIEEVPPGSELPAGQLPGYSSSGEASTEGGEPQPSENSADNSKAMALATISDRPAAGFWTSGDNVFYLDQEGKIYRARTNEDEEVNVQKLGGPLNQISSDLSGNLVLISFGNPLSPSWTIFDNRDAAYRPLNQEIKYAAWGNRTGELLAIRENSNSAQLVYLDADKLSSSPKIILADFRMESVQIQAAGEDKFLIHELPDGEYAGKIWLLNTKNQNLSVLRDLASNQIVQVASPQVFFVWSGGGNFEINKNSDLTKQIPVPFSALPPKCGADGYLAFCFASQETNESGLAEFLKNRVFFRDSLYKIDALSEDWEIVNLESLNNNNPIDGKNPRVAGSSLVFLNRLDGKVYQLTNFR